MKNSRLLLYLLILHLPFCQYLFSQPDTQDSEKFGNLIVIVSGLKNNNGDVKTGLFNSSASFDGEEEKFRGATLTIDSAKVEWIIENIPYGEYAIKVFHDEDSDNIVDTNFIGIPKERYGFSNNPKILFKPPSFEKAKFSFNYGEQKIEIKLK